jgi:ABC-type transporter Mla subunit MlaD
MTTSSTQEEILRTLQQINRTAANTDEVSAATGELISAQGDQIKGIAFNAETIESNLNTSERLIRGIKSWGGRMANYFSSSSNPNGLPSYMPTAALGEASREQNDGARVSTHHAISTPQGFDQEVDQQLDRISSMIGNIKERSMAISSNISEQVSTVQSASTSVAQSTDRMNKQHTAIKQFR